MAARRKPQAAPPASDTVFFCFKLGPVPTEQGPAFDVYVGMHDGEIAPMVSGVSASAAMRQLAEYGAGSVLRCEPRLARAGKAHGFEAAEPPPWAQAVRCGITVCMALGPSMTPDCMLPAHELAAAARKFFRGAPWQYWHSDVGMKFEASGVIAQTFEGCVMGNGGQEYGVALYEGKGSLEKLVKLQARGGNARAVAQMNCIAVTFDPAPEFAAAVLEDVIGVPVLPIPTRVDRGRMGTPSGKEILTLAAALAAASGLTPTTLVGIGGASDGRGNATVKVTAASAPTV